MWANGVSGQILKPVGRLLKERKPLQFIKAKGVAMLVPFDFAMIFHSFSKLFDTEGRRLDDWI